MVLCFLVNIGSGNGLSPVRCQAWTNPLGTIFSKIWIIHILFYKNALMKMSSAKCLPFCLGLSVLTHWGRVTHICVDNLNIIASDNGLSPGRHQATIWTIAGILLIGPLETNFSVILIEIHIFLFKKMHFKMLSGKWWPFCLGLSLLQTFLPLTEGVGGAVRFLVVGTIGQEERPPRGQLWMEQCLTSLKYWPI